MGESKLNVDCQFCEQQHRPRFLCNPAKRILDTLIERGMSFNMPTIEFPEPLPGIEQQLGLNPGDKLPQGEVLPQWLYAGNAEDLRGVAALVADITEMAIRRAKELDGHG